MKPQWRRFASLGLYLSLLAAIAAVILYIIMREWNLYIQVALGLVVIGLALFAILDPERTRLALTGRQARYGSNALVMSLAFVGILVVVNYLVFKNPKRWDLTEDKSNTLAPETIETLEKLPQPVEAQAFFTQQVSSSSAENMLEQYKFNSQGKFEYRFINPDEEPLAAQNAGITRDGTVVLKMGDRQEQVASVTETELTGALVRLMGNKVSIYFLTGHGEANLDEAGDESYQQVKTALQNKSYQVETLNLLATNEIPADAKVIVIAGPKQPFTQPEVDLLKNFQENGGGLVVLGEPTVVTQTDTQADPLTGYLAQTWGIQLANDIVVDRSSQQLLQAVSYEYGQHPITQKLYDQGLATAFLTARSVRVGESPDGVTATELIRTSPNSWAETDLAKLEETINNGQSPQPDQGEDQAGPVPIAAAAERTANRARVVVIGDSHFAINANFFFLGNGDLMINSIDWVAEQENLINLTPKDTVSRVVAPPRQYTYGLILFASVIFLPGILLLAGIVVWIQRRRRG